MRIVTFSKNSWAEYTEWQKIDKKVLQKINELIKDVLRNPFEGIGKPEPLKYELAGYWSRRISLEHRLVYRIIDNELYIYSCMYHYDD